MKTNLMLVKSTLLASLCLCLALSTAWAGSAENTTTEKAPVSLTIAHLNDIYEIQPIEGGKYGGPARVATIIAGLKQKASPLLVTLGGDYLSPSALGTAKIDGQPLAGRQMVDVLNAIGLDWATLGNHEFDVSEESFRAHLNQAQFRVIATNVSDAQGKPFPGTVPSAIVPVTSGKRTLRIGLLGVTVPSNPKSWVRFRDPIEAAKEEIGRMQGKTDAIIALTHLNLAQDANFVTAIPEVDLVLGDHEHENWQLQRGPGFTPIIKADANVRSLAIVTLNFHEPGQKPSISTTIQLIDESIPSDPEVAALADRWTQLGLAAFRQDGFIPEAVVAVTDETLDGREMTVRNRPGKLTDLVAQAMFHEGQPCDVALFNAGSIRIDDVLPAGPLSQYDIIRLLPFGGKVNKARLDGALLVRVLEAGANNQGLGGYLHSKGAQLENGVWQISGQDIEPDKRYTVILPEFLLSGREVNLGFLSKGNPQMHEIQVLRDIRYIVIDELKKTFPPNQEQSKE